MAEFDLSEGTIRTALKLGGVNPDGVLVPLASAPDHGVAAELPEDEDDEPGSEPQGDGPPMTLEEIRARLGKHLRNLDEVKPTERASYFTALRILTPLVKALEKFTPEETPDVNRLPEIVTARDEMRARVRTVLEKERARRTDPGAEKCLGCGRAHPLRGEKSPAQELIDFVLDAEGK